MSGKGIFAGSEALPVCPAEVAASFLKAFGTGARGGALALLAGALAAATDTPGRHNREMKRGLGAPFSIPRREPGRKDVKF